MTDKIVVLSTCGSAEQAAAIARRLVENRLAACVTVIPGARSFYRWKGAIEDSVEWLLLIKSRRDLFGRLRDELGALHSYEVPELLALPVSEGAPSYLEWMENELLREAG
ncbi:MAG: divalent-cation tolerance protein CutA [Bryobacteraceae bacterium]